MRRDGDFVLYWMIAGRRLHWNFGLQRAVERARELNKPLLILEALRSDYPWACDRFHRFVIEGMAEKTRRLARRRVGYHAYVEPVAGAGRGLLEALGARACVVVTDDFPAFFLPRMVRTAARRLTVLTENVDSIGLLPLRAADRVFPTAYAFRRFLQKVLPEHLDAFPDPDPLSGVPLVRLDSVPAAVPKRWPSAPIHRLAPRTLASLPIDHTVSGAAVTGGERAGRELLRVFLDERLSRYVEERNQPESETTSGLSPYLHFGHVSAHQVFAELRMREGWSLRDLSRRTDGKRTGWWGMGPGPEAFLDQLVTWRELGFNFCHHRSDHDAFESLPEWALRTLAEHAGDPRTHRYSLEQLAEGRTHDPLWNAAQMQLAREGRIHNYLRMLWGKKILEWSGSPEEALEIMIELNNRYALDGRDPNSYSGIFWVLGRYDRAWGPERPVFGKIRYMSSENTARKVRVKDYIRRYAP